MNGGYISCSFGSRRFLGFGKSCLQSPTANVIFVSERASMPIQRAKVCLPTRSQCMQRVLYQYGSTDHDLWGREALTELLCFVRPQHMFCTCCCLLRQFHTNIIRQFVSLATKLLLYGRIYRLPQRNCILVFSLKDAHIDNINTLFFDAHEPRE